MKERVVQVSQSFRVAFGWSSASDFLDVASHLYSGFLNKFRWFVLRFGWSEVVLKPLRSVSAPLILPFLKREKFHWNGIDLEGFYHRYNVTWAGERIVEIPIAKSFLDGVESGRVLEVGNVISHYWKVRHKIVDKFEVGEGVVNCDIIAFKSESEYDLILSISTFEHIGFDDNAASSSGDKIKEAVIHCRRLLSPRGLLVITVPLGYNPELDQLISAGKLSPVRQSFLVRHGFSRWKQCDLMTATEHPYRFRYPYANSICVLEFDKLETQL